MQYIAFVTKGLEKISEDEIQSLKDTDILSTEQKTIKFEYSGKLENLKTLRTVDDIGIYISEISVENLKELRIDNELEIIKEVIDIISQYRDINERFSITISKYKNNDIKEDDLKQILSKYFSSNLNLLYTPLDHSNIDIRFNISEEKCLITIKVFTKSLFHREYEHESHLGCLRSTIAASMLYRLVGEDSNLKVVDNFCGSGTFLCEALMLGNKVYGNDIDKSAVDVTKRNLNRIRKGEYNITNYDASNTKWKNNFFDIAISNYPWDKQIKVDKMSYLVDTSIKEYSRILKKESKIGIITTKPELIIKYLKKYFDIQDIEEYKIGYLGQVPTIVLASINRRTV